MFIPGSNHVERLSEHGRNLTFETLQRHRGLLDKILAAFGEMELKDITPAIVDNYLRTLEKRSGAWKKLCRTYTKRLRFAAVKAL